MIRSNLFILTISVSFTQGLPPPPYWLCSCDMWIKMLSASPLTFFFLSFKEMVIHFSRHLKKKRTNIWRAVLAWKGGALCKHSKCRWTALCEWKQTGGRRATNKDKPRLCKYSPNAAQMQQIRAALFTNGTDSYQTHDCFNSVLDIFKHHRKSTKSTRVPEQAGMQDGTVTESNRCFSSKDCSTFSDWH